MSKSVKTVRRSKIRRRVRSKISGTAEKPRLSIYKSSKHIYTQVINDQEGVTIAAASSLSRDLKDDLQGKPGMEMAELIGQAIGKAAMDQGISTVVFDRSGYKYHGIVRKVAEGARKAGLQF